MSIYNTSRTDKSKVRAPVRRGAGPLRPGMGAQRLMEQQRAQQQMQQPQEELTFNEFQLMSTSKRGQNHLMDFKSSKRVEPNKFARPVKLHRKETNFIPYRQYIQNLNAQNAANAAAAAAAAAKAAAIMAGTTIPNDNTNNKINKNVEDLGNEISPDGPQVTPQPQHGPKTGADTSLIAPLGGATRNKQMLFKKRTKQIYLAKEDTRELKEQEHRPWILEDYDSHNSFNGTLEGGQRSDYMFFVLSDNGFKVMPVDRWYKFQPKRNFKTLTLEEAEEQLKKQQKRENGRWMMLKRENEQAETADVVRPNKLKVVDTDEVAKTGSDDEGNNRQDSDMDDLDFDDVFQDDDEATAEHEVEDEDVKDSKDRVKKEIKDFAIGNQEVDDEYDEMGKLTSEGKQMRKLVRDLEKNRAYESDDDVDPYASSAEELDSDANDEDGEEDNESKEKEKKNASALKKKAVAPPSKPVMPKKAHTAKVKKEGMSKPIGRPGSPSLYINKRESSPAGRTASPVRPSSPLKEARPSSPLNTSSSSSPSRPAHRASPTPSSPSKEHSKKRKMKDIAAVSSVDTKHRKIGKSSDLITEQEVIDTLRGHPMTTQDFLMNFRKRIKSNSQNRAIITDLLRKVARRSNSADPSTRMLELKPEFQ
ncbi:hypothetical protein BDF21DRAFT_442935 [Thamnidium elegans]|uniref:Transcription initiation factor IIF subunit alpha n=1 Tax=Thamnidium elegans TaxID=101142 RepID=A0A8H7VZN1_9FUNG|nr:hypothetical protein INT48_009040 [Thamnidium elegans]KAI8090439.1 hypothetical protein BDF21DRAFT_442935 [Thamnidium elegans]